MLNTAYRTGGSEHSSADLMNAMRRRNIDCRMFVGTGANSKLGLFPIPSRSPRIAAFLSYAGELIESAAGGASSNQYVRTFVRKSKNLVNRFELPLFAPRSVDYIGPVGSFRLLSNDEWMPDLIHAHNLHGGPYRAYFDLRALPSLSNRVPFVLSLRDGWTMSGHCVHSFDCDRWLTGCGHCPDLSIYPAIPTDRTAQNWSDKRAIYGASRLYVHALSDWIKQRAERSILAEGIRDLRVIHTGVDRVVFRPGDKEAARRRLNLPFGRRILTFVARLPTENPCKDFDCLQACLMRLGADEDLGPITLVAIGGNDEARQRVGSAELVFWPYSADRNRLADLYRAADISLHAARVDTFPRVVLEALSCGTPVIATAVSGIPEQIRSLDVPFRANVEPYCAEEATGILVKAGDAAAMAAAVQLLFADEALMRKLGANAAEDASNRFDLEHQTDRLVAWYEEVIADFQSQAPRHKR